LSLAFVFPFRCRPLCSLAPPWNDSKPALQVAVFPFTGFSHKLWTSNSTAEFFFSYLLTKPTLYFVFMDNTLLWYSCK
jgi:hypothetical protein